LVTAIYRTTAKNKPRFEFLERSGFHCGNDGATEWLNSWMIIERKEESGDQSAVPEIFMAKTRLVRSRIPL